MKDIVIIWGAFFTFGAMCTLWEFLTPARYIHYLSEILRDIGAFVTVFFFFLIVGMIVHLSLPIVGFPQFLDIVENSGMWDSPLWLRLIVFYLVWDFSLYWVHWLMHTKFMWPTHKWHHVPKAVWWFVGVRGSFPHIIITYLPFLWAWIFGLPIWLMLLVSVGGVIGNAWMHINVTGRWMRWMEVILVTPRFHSIHHSDFPAHYTKNFGSLFTLWDRMFGTYINPEEVNIEKLRFGIGEKVHPLRLAIGV